MKKTYILILFSFLLSAFCFGNEQVKSFSLDWRIEMWQANSYTQRVLMFEQAVFPKENQHPYFSTNFPFNENTQISIRNIQKENLTEPEIALLDTSSFHSEIALRVSKQNSGKDAVLNVLFLPFVKENGNYKKIVSFDLIVTDNQDTNSSFLKQKKASALHSFAENSKLSSGKWVKMKVSSSGIYKLTYQDILSAGINANDFGIYGYGGAMLNEDFSVPKQDDLPQVAFYMNKGSDGVFNSGDYVLFYAQGPVSWKFDEATSDFHHIANLYSTHAYYFLASGTGDAPKLIELSPEVDLNGSSPINIMSFTDRFVHEKDLVNLAHSGREFYGEEFNPSSLTKTIGFNVPNLILGVPMSVKFDAALYSISDASQNSSFKVALGPNTTNVSAANISSSQYYIKGTIATKTFSFIPNSSQLNFNLTFNPAVSSAKGYLNYIRINVQRNLVMTGSSLFFRTPGFRNSEYGRFILTSSNNPNLKIWDITEPNNAVEVFSNYDTELSAFTFLAKNTDQTTIKEYVALDITASYAKPEIVGSVVNQNLHALPNVEYVMITHPDYLQQAQELALAHQQKDNLSVVIVTPEQIYNEFSSGTPDATAYRWFLKMFYDRYQNGYDSTPLKYLLLFGDGTYDNRQVLSSPDACNKILAYQSYNSLDENYSYVTDDYFGFLDDNEGISPSADVLDIGVGRIPANTVQHAADVVAKTIHYMNNQNKGRWKNQLCFLADDGDNNDHMSQSDQLANKTALNYPNFEITKLFLDAYNQQTTASGSRYPEVREKLHNSIKNGMLLLNYTGHGGTEGWTDERILTKEDVINMYNENQALWVTATCDFSRFDSKEISAGEHVLLNPNGGGVAMFTTTRTVYSHPNFNLNMKFTDYVFSRDENNKRLRLGDIMKKSKASLSNEPNNLKFILLGDPALLLAYPSFQVVTDSINGLDATQPQMTTIGALDIVTIKGHIDDEGLVMDDFNGFVEISVFDKEQNIKTLNNDACTTRVDCGVYTYRDRSIIFAGKAEVVDGYFSISFIVPKDINYAFGTAKITYYAADENNDFEANGSYTHFIVGGSSSREINDNEGPQIQMYLNTPDFSSGDVVNESPLFVANVSDENGINIIGNGVGHDIVLMLDNQDWIILNSYYQPNMGTYQSGVVRYKFNDLSEGKHTLTFRAWDLQNNSSSEIVNFEVKKGKSVDIIDVYCYPNPASDETFFMLTHDRPDELVNVVLRVFDLSGRELWNYDTDIYPTDNSTQITSWDLKTGSGQTLQRGVYLFKVEVESSSGKMSSKSKKMIISK